jgi:MFS family permease
VLYRSDQLVVSPLLGYVVVVFLMGLQDAVMSYTAPVYMEQVLGNSLVMGVLMGVAALTGLCFDIILSRWCDQRSFRFFLSATLVTAFVFPLILLLLPPTVVILILAMMIWGMYYELSQFAHFNFIHLSVNKEGHARAWGVISVFKAAAYMVGPLLAGSLVGWGMNWVFKVVLGLAGLVFLALVIFLKSFDKEKVAVEKKVNARSFWRELGIWRVLMRKVWPLWLFVVVIFLVDASFWSVGAILSEELRKAHVWGGMVLTVYMLPSLVVGLGVERMARPLGKKRIAFIAGMVYGLLLMMVGIMPSVPLLLLLILVAATFGAVAVPEILAVFEDFMARLGEFGGEVISLERSAENLAFIVGPALAGAIALVVGFQETFTVMGGVLFLVASLAFLVVPRKIRLPQQELGEI